MGNADSGLRTVNVLAAGTRGAVDINLQISRIDVHINLFNLRQNRDRGRRGMHPALRLRYRYALDTVRAGFKFELGENIFAGNLG